MPSKRFAVKRHPVTQPSDPSYRLIPLTQGQNALVDTSDFKWLSEWNWYARKDFYKNGVIFYAYRQENRRVIPMHVQILKCKADHKNRNGLDNRRSNLRPCTESQNCMNRGRYRNNRSGFKGVSWDAIHKGWRASIAVQAKCKNLGVFKLKEDAARTYNEAAKKLHGEFASLNEIPKS
jgi:hypothetical protein